jgi:SAM-dependent methyltransferase
MANKLERMLGTAGPQGAGLEIGALNAPMVRKPEHRVRYVDYATTEVIKANQRDPVVKVEEIVEVDLVWGGEPLLNLAGDPVDYVVASHVIEHVPDLIGWLQEIGQALRPGGVLGLAIPDKRFTFDALRHNSVLAEAVEAWLAGCRRPSPRQIFDAASLGVAVDAAQVWAGDFEPAARRDEVMGRLKPALGLARSVAESSEYRDAHCWVFTPESFLDLADELAVLELLPFRIEDFFPTDAGAAEFHARLVKTAPDAAEVRASIAAAREALAAAAPPGPGPAPPEPAPPAPPPVEILAAETVAADTAELDRLRRALDEITASTSWKLTAPLRALRRTLRV